MKRVTEKPVSTDTLRILVTRLREKEVKLPTRWWNHFVNRHNTGGGLYGERQGAMELQAHPALGAGKALYHWQGEEGYAISDFIAETRNWTPVILDALEELVERRDADSKADA